MRNGNKRKTAVLRGKEGDCDCRALGTDFLASVSVMHQGDLGAAAGHGGALASAGRLGCRR